MRENPGVKRGVLTALSICLAVSCMAPAAAAQAVQGKKCNKVGASQRVNGSTLICTARGSQRVWLKAPRKVIRPTTSSPAVPATPTPQTPTISVTADADLLQIAACKLQDASANLFRLGFPMEPIVPGVEKIRILAIPLEFTDTLPTLISRTEVQTIFRTVANYFAQESRGRLAIEFVEPPIETATGRPASITLPDTAEAAGWYKSQGIPYGKDYAESLLARTSDSWDLSRFDGVVIYSADSRTRNFIGGIGLRGSERGLIPDQQPLTSPSGKVDSLVLTSALTGVIAHELGHSLFGWIDLYANDVADKFAKGWGLMASSWTGNMTTLGWERWLAGWLDDAQIRCASPDKASTHLLTFLDNRETSPSLLVVPSSTSKALVVQVEDWQSKICLDRRELCRGGTARGALAYQVDVSKLSSEGAIVVPEELRWPKVITTGSSLVVDSMKIEVGTCTAQGCEVKVSPTVG